MNVTPENALFLRDVYVAQLEKEHQALLGLVKAMPDDKLTYKPDDRNMDFGSLARHIAESGQFFAKTIVDGQVMMDGQPPEAPPMPSTGAGLAAELETHFEATMKAFKGFDADQLCRNIDFFGMGDHAGVFYINWYIVHMIHHRGQLTTYMRVAGAKVPSVYGPTMDVTFEDMMEGQGS